MTITGPCTLKWILEITPSLEDSRRPWPCANSAAVVVSRVRGRPARRVVVGDRVRSSRSSRSSRARRHAAPAAYSLPLARPATAGASAALIGADRTSRQQLSAPGERRPRRSAPSRATSRSASSGGTEISRRSHAPSGLHYYAASADAVNVSRCADAGRRSRPEPNTVLCADTHTLGTARQRRRERGGRAGSRGVIVHGIVSSDQPNVDRSRGDLLTCARCWPLGKRRLVRTSS
jgi:hypothetical protein